MPFFAIDPTALVLAILFVFLGILLYRQSKIFPYPEIFVSTLTRFFPQDSSSTYSSWKERLQALPRILKLIALGTLLLAFLDLRLHFDHKGTNDNKHPPPHEKLVTEGIAMYLVLDQSGSMAEDITSRLPNGQLERISKVNLLKKVTTAFIKGDSQYGLDGRPNDLIGLVEFARTAHVVVPLTLDRKVLLNKLNEFNVVPEFAQDGTAIGYALLKTINLITATRNYARDLIGQGKPAYEIKNFVVILVTDGLQDPNPADKESRWRNIDPREAALAAKEHNIRIYIVNVDPRNGTENFAPNRRQLQQTAETTGGKFFIVDSTTDLPEIYASIDKLEKSPLPFDEEVVKRLKESIAKEKLPGIYDTFFLAPYLIAFGFLSLFLGILLGCTLLRKVP